MFRKRWRRPDKREDAKLFNAWEHFYAAAANKEPASFRVIAPKRDRIRRADGKPILPTEHDEQVVVIQWWRTAHGLYRLPEFALYAVPNGSFLGSGYMTAGRLRTEGVRRGVPDLMLAAPTPAFAGLYVELKRIGGDKPSPEQEAFIAYLLSAGYSASVHYGATSAIKEIEDYLSALLP